MKFTVLQSNSKGNGYLLHNDHECLILECGVPLKEVKKALNFKMDLVVGAVVSHRHSDHAKYIDEYLKAGIPVYSNEDTINKATDKSLTHKLKAQKKYKIGGFTIIPIDANHDVPCFSYAIIHEDIGAALFAIDTSYIKAIVEGLDYLFIECNYAEDILEQNVNDGKVTFAQMTRLQQTHMELEQTIQEAVQCKEHSDNLKFIVLLHLSDNNSNEDQFISTVEQATGIPTQAARKGDILDMLYAPTLSTADTIGFSGDRP